MQQFIDTPSISKDVPECTIDVNFPVTKCINFYQDEDDTIAVKEVLSGISGLTSIPIERMKHSRLAPNPLKDGTVSYGLKATEAFINHAEVTIRGNQPLDECLYVTVFNIANREGVSDKEWVSELPCEMSFVGVKYKDTFLAFHGVNVEKEYTMAESLDPSYTFRHVHHPRQKRIDMYKHMLTIALGRLAEETAKKSLPLA